MEKTEQQIKNEGWLCGKKHEMLARSEAAFIFHTKPCLIGFCIEATTRDRNFFSSKDYLALLLHWEQNGSEPTLGEAIQVIVPAPPFKQKK